MFVEQSLNILSNDKCHTVVYEGDINAADSSKNIKQPV